MILNIIQAVSAILLILSILIQSKGSGLGAAFGGGDAIAHTKRGAEKYVYYFAIAMAIIFLASSFLNVIY
ncbi:MAG: preprotein translocase subunit SecG [Janthinobacterium sp.]|jgi:protein translocase SecG subunit